MVDIVLGVVFWFALASGGVRILSRLAGSDPKAFLQAWSGVAMVIGVALTAGLIYSLLAQFGFGMAMEDYCREIMTTVEPKPLVNGYPNEWFTGPAYCYQAHDGQVIVYGETSFAVLKFLTEVIGPVALACAIIAFGFSPQTKGDHRSLALSSG